MLVRLFMILILSSLSILLSGCQGGNEKDYWKMDDPTLVIYNDDGVFNFKNPGEMQIHKSSDLPISYASHIRFNHLNKDVRLDIATQCKVNEQLFHSTKESETIYQKLYFYNYIPAELISNNDIHNFSCSFQLIAVNSINSKITYHINNLNFNTQNSNNVLISKNQNLLSTNTSGFIEPVDISNTHNNFVALLDGKGLNNSISKINLYCSGNLIETFDNLSGVRDISLNNLFQTRELNSRYFYKNCRLMVHTILSPLTRSQDLNGLDFQTLWSPYFHLIQYTPEIVAQIKMLDSSHAYYSDNTESFDYNFAELEFKNIGHVPVYIKKPNDTLAKMNISFAMKPLYISNRNFPTRVRDAAHTSLLDRNLPNAILTGELTTKIQYLTDNPLEENLIDLSLGSNPKIKLKLEKNFRCSINKKTENGIWVKAIRQKTIEDEIEVYVLINNKLERFPTNLYLSDLIKTTSALNPESNSEYLIDGLLLPKIKINSYREQGSFHEKYLQNLELIFELSQTDSLSTYKKFLYKSSSVRQHCRMFE